MCMRCVIFKLTCLSLQTTRPQRKCFHGSLTTLVLMETSQQIKKAATKETLGTYRTSILWCALESIFSSAAPISRRSGSRN